MAVARKELQRVVRKAGGAQKGEAKGGSKDDKKMGQYQKVQKKKKSGFIDTVFSLLIFLITLIFFLNFAGIIDLPFLKSAIPLKSGRVNTSTSEMETGSISSERVMDGEIYPGPDLPKVDQSKEVPPPSHETEKSLPESFQQSEKPVSDTIEQPAVSSGEQENLWRLAKIYAAMDPEEAARLLQRLSDEEVIQIFSVMKERNVAEILSIFPPERGASLIKKMMEGR